FGRSEMIDANVGEGVGVDPSLSGTRPGQALVAYRAITFNFNGNTFSNAVQLRPGDVMADIRLARLKGLHWARIGAVNRNPEASMRPPSPTNGPQVAIAPDGAAAVAWQEPDQTGVARIWLRRVFGTALGLVLEASPASWQGAPVSADADALSLGVSPLGQVGVASRIAVAAGSTLSGRLLYNSLPSTDALGAAKLNGAVLADGGAPVGGSGPPDVAVSDEGGAEGSLRLGFLAGTQPQLIGLDGSGALRGLPVLEAPPALPGSAPVTAIGPGSGGLLAYASVDAAGRPGVEIHQEAASGAIQTGLISGPQGGPVSELAIGRAGSGDALIAFRQGEPGHFQIVAERVSAPPAAFAVEVPSGWIRPGLARLRWQVARSAVGGVAYSVLLNGRAVARDLRRRAFRLHPGQLGDGVQQVRVMATDLLGEQLLSKPAKLRVDGEAPLVQVESGKEQRVAVRIRDPDSGLKARATAVRFGDGEGERGGAGFRHAYQRPGHYTVTVRAADRAGNRLRRHFEVSVG
ncbi:MAG TPA: PKD domain-containing protein, partial [Solirubrobacterales bacterium]